MDLGLYLIHTGSDKAFKGTFITLICRSINADSHADRHVDRQTDRQADRQADRLLNWLKTSCQVERRCAQA